MSEIKSCIVCDAVEFEKQIELKDFSITKQDFEIYKCCNCNFVFTQKPPAEDNIGKYYESENYISHSDTKKSLFFKVYHLVRNFMLWRKFSIIKKLNTGNKILDIGCGTGYFLNYMKQKSYKVLGLEVSEKTKNYGIKKFKIDIKNPKELEQDNIADKFDVVTMWHVLEHIYNPKMYFQKIANVLNDNGYLIIALPNNDSFDAKHYKNYWAGYDVPRHLWHFTPKTFKNFAEKNGFKLLKMNRLPFDAFFVSMLSEKYKGNSLGFIKGAFVGFLSFIQSTFKVEKTSSVIYILSKIS